MVPLIHRIWPWLADVNAPSLRADAAAALLAAVLVLPQAIAFAALAGLPTTWGLLTAAVPCVVAALAGSSRHVLTGPTNTMSLALAAALVPLAALGSAEYLRLALVVTLMVGVVQIGVALLRLGVLAHFIAPSVLLGFTTGAAVLIAWHALKSLSGWPTLDLEAVGLGVFVVTVYFGQPSFVAPLWIVLFALMGAALLGALGLIAGLWSEKFDQMAVFQNFVIMPMTFLSGVFYSIHSLPKFWQAVSHFNPFFYMIDGFRYGFFGLSDVSPWLSLGIVLTATAAASALAVHLLRIGYNIRS